jgi:predicted nucleic acid-binding Zn ribbon protein
MGQQKLYNDFKYHSQRQSVLNSEISALLNGLKTKKNERFAFWEAVLGKKISEVAVPVKNKRGILFVKVQDSIWRFELARNKDEIIKKLNEHLKKNSVKDLVFI